MENIAVVGAGTMGNGIAHVAAALGFTVTLIDVRDDLLQHALSTVSANLQRGVDKGRMAAADKQATLDRIRTTTDLRTAATSDLAVEAIVENLSAKEDLFRKLDGITPQD